MKKGKARQTFMAVTEPSAVDGSPSQEMVKFASISPSEDSSPLMTPKGASISTQIMPATVGASSHGTISSPRASERKAALRRMVEQQREREADDKVQRDAEEGEDHRLQNAFQNSGSLSRVSVIAEADPGLALQIAVVKAKPR